jgi:hypothetical protein
MPLTYVELDPATDQPLKPAQQPAAQAPAQAQGGAPAPGQKGFDREKFASDSADRSMAYASQRGTPSMADWQEARKAAWESGFKAMQEAKQAELNRQGELAKQESMLTFEQFCPR